MARTPPDRSRENARASSTRWRRASLPSTWSMEQAISLDVVRLTLSQRNLRTILRSIFQLMRFYIEKTPHLLCCFRPKVFLQILGSFRLLFNQELGEMFRRFREQGPQGLGVALLEGVADLNRLGHYCFAGSSKTLASSVLEPLKVIGRPKKGA